jgi:hypothetical protein
MAVRLQSLRELKLLKTFEGDAAIALTKERQALLDNFVEPVVGGYLAGTFGVKLAISTSFNGVKQNANRPGRKVQKGAVSNWRMEMKQASNDLRNFVIRPGVMAEEVLAFVNNRSTVPKSAALIAGLLKEVEDNRLGFQR